MRDLITPSVPAPMLEKATGASLDVQRNWFARGLFTTLPIIPEARAGKPRLYPLLSTYEAAMLMWARENSMELSWIHAAWEWRGARLGRSDTRHGLHVAWGTAELIRAAKAGALPEFGDPTEPPVFWFLFHRDVAAKPEFAALKVGTIADLPDLMGELRDPKPGHIALNVTAFVAAVDGRLAQAGWQPPNTDAGG